MSDVCALPGCTEPVEQQPEGAPPRKYCCQAHRTAARVHRAAARHAPQPLPEPATDPEPVRAGGGSGESSPAVSRQPVPLGQLRKRPAWPTTRMAVAAGLAAALVLGGGTALIDAGQHSTPEALTPPPLPPGGAQWLDKAHTALTSADTQLPTINAALQHWQALAAARGSSLAPPEVEALEARKAFLESQRSILTAQIAAWQNLQQNTAALATANTQLASLAHAADQPGQPADIEAQLAGQRATLQARIQMLFDQAATWQQDVAQASTTPMPDLAPQATTVLVSRVDDLGNSPNPLPPPLDSRGDSGSILAGRSPNSGDQERDLPATGAPPRPNGDAVSATVADASFSQHDQHGVEDTLATATKPDTDTGDGTGLLGDNGGVLDTGGQDHSGGASEPATAGDGATAAVQHTTGQVGHTLGGAVDALTGPVQHTPAAGQGAPSQTNRPGGPSNIGAALTELTSGQPNPAPATTLPNNTQDTPVGSVMPAVLVGMRAVGDLVGQAIDAQRSTQHQQQPSSGPIPTTSTTTAYATDNSALMRIADTTYRVSLPSSMPPGPQQPTGASRPTGASSRAGDRRPGTAAPQPRTPATPSAHQLGSQYARTGATKDPTTAPGAQNHSTNTPAQPAAKHSSTGSAGGSRSSTKQPKAKHSNSKNHSSTKTASTKHPSTKHPSTKSSGSGG